MHRIRALLGIPNHSVDGIVAPLGAIIRQLEAAAVAHGKRAAAHVARAAYLQRQSERAVSEADRAKRIAAKAVALLS